MSDFINFANIFLIIIFVLTYYAIYKRSPYVFGILLLPFSFLIQLLVSSAYIETGTYLIDFLQTSYATGATFRLFFLLELQMIIFLLFSNKIEKALKRVKVDTFGKRKIYMICRICVFIVFYLLLDVLIFGSVDRFSYYARTKSLPMINIVSYFSYPLTFIMGFIASKYRNKRTIFYSMLYLLLTIIWLYLRGVQFGGYLISIILFFTCFVIELAKKRKLIRVRYIILSVVILLLVLIPKYNFFSRSSIYSSMGYNTAYEKLMYRAFSQNADLTWVIDKQIVKDGYKDFGQLSVELSSFIDNSNNNSGVYYLMKRACPRVVLERYFSGTAMITGGYPIIWAAILGYFGAIFPVILEALLFAYLIYKISVALVEENYLLLLMLVYIYAQCYSIIMSSGIFYLGNVIPKVFLGILLILDLIHKPITFGSKRII